jgi:hypothetical protein
MSLLKRKYDNGKNSTNNDNNNSNSGKDDISKYISMMHSS